MHELTVAGTKVSYTTVGRGPGLVLLHGSTSDAKAGFAAVIDDFSAERTVIGVDYAGCGQSTIPPGELTLDLLVQQVAAAVRAVTDEPVDVVGFSLGADVAAALAAQHPALVRRLVLIAGWPHSDDPRHQLVFGSWIRLLEVGEEHGMGFGVPLAFSPGYLATLDAARLQGVMARGFPPGMRQRLELARRIDLRPLLPRIKAPTLVVGLTQDYLVPIAGSRALHTAIGGSQYAEIDAGHVVFAEKPREVAGLLRRFLG